jgi:transcriptional regulator of acetoin/glycerol metabolism
MRRLQPTKEVLASWRRCLEGGVPNTIKSPVLCLECDELKMRQAENSLIISTFEDSIRAVEDLIPVGYHFFLADSSGALIKKNKAV